MKHKYRVSELEKERERKKLEDGKYSILFFLRGGKNGVDEDRETG